MSSISFHPDCGQTICPAVCPVLRRSLVAAHLRYDALQEAAVAAAWEAGALGGVEALPARLLDDLEYRVELIELAYHLYNLAT